jgi:hypothetical protein
MTDTTDAPPSYDNESQWRQALLEIQEKLTAYQKAKAEGDKITISVAEGLLVDAMRRAAQLRPDSEEGRQWGQRANDLAVADSEGKENILEGVGKGLLLIVGAPIVAAGAVLYGAGRVVAGIGELLSFGAIGKFKSKSLDYLAIMRLGRLRLVPSRNERRP